MKERKGYVWRADTGFREESRRIEERKKGGRGRRGGNEEKSEIGGKGVGEEGEGREEE